jgi:glycosyltransferase involved in cell wall biosynthesis
MAKKVLILCPGGLDAAGGIGRMMAYLIDELHNHPEPPECRVLDTRGPGHIMWAPFHFGRALLQMTAEAMRGSVLLVHVNLASGGSTVRKAIAVTIARLLHLPMLIHLHSGDYIEFFRDMRDSRKGVVRWMFASARHTVVLGRHWRQFVVEDIGVAPDCTHVIFNGAPPPDISAIARRPIPDGPVQLLFLGSLLPEKGIGDILNALAAPELNALDWRLVLAGNGAVERYRQEAEALGIVDRVSFPGWVDTAAVQDYLRRSEVLLLPSYMEGLSMAVVEGLAHGLAVITSPLGAMRDILIDRQSAVLVEPGDRDGLMSALRDVICDADLRLRIGMAGRAVFDEHLNMRKIAAQFLEIYAKYATPEADPDSRTALAGSGTDRADRSVRETGSAG